jgi:hypothetical protein
MIEMSGDVLELAEGTPEAQAWRQSCWRQRLAAAGADSLCPKGTLLLTCHRGSYYAGRTLLEAGRQVRRLILDLLPITGAALALVVREVYAFEYRDRPSVRIEVLP